VAYLLMHFMLGGSRSGCRLHSCCVGENLGRCERKLKGEGGGSMPCRRMLASCAAAQKEARLPVSSAAAAPMARWFTPTRFPMASWPSSVEFAALSSGMYTLSTTCSPPLVRDVCSQ